MTTGTTGVLGAHKDVVRNASIRRGVAMAALPGFGLVWLAVFAGAEALHAAAHDTRTSTSFPCHRRVRLMLARMLTSGLLGGFTAGLLAALLHPLRQPVLLEAERCESNEIAQPSAAAEAHDHGGAAVDVASACTAEFPAPRWPRPSTRPAAPSPFSPSG